MATMSLLAGLGPAGAIPKRAGVETIAVKVRRRLSFMVRKACLVSCLGVNPENYPEGRQLWEAALDVHVSSS